MTGADEGLRYWHYLDISTMPLIDVDDRMLLSSTLKSGWHEYISTYIALYRFLRVNAVNHIYNAAFADEAYKIYRYSTHTA